MKTSTQLKAHLRNFSKKTNVEVEILLRNFMLERFLERVSISEYRNNFILKGGLLIAAIVGIDTRSTMDMDATIKEQTLSSDEITIICEKILSIEIEDGVELSFRGIEQIREESDYPGYRVSIEAKLDKTRQILKVDITTGDYITPKAIEYKFKLMFEEREINILAYNLETVLAEKYETTITRGITNTRMRDLYDIYVLINTQSYDSDTFRAALQNTIKKRDTAEQMSGAAETIQMIAESEIMIDLWRRYQAKYFYAADISWDMVIGAVTALSAKTKPEYISEQ
jgi:predicted nucleotidyltransferase component of viral defense system